MSVTESFPSIRNTASRRRTIGGGATSLALLLAVLVPAAASAATDFVVDEGTLVRVEGTLLVLSGQESAEDHAEHGPIERTTLLPEKVRLITDDGISIPLSGGLPGNVESGNGFSGTLSVPAESVGAINDTIAEAIAGQASREVVDADSVVGTEIIEASDALEVPLTVDDATITRETSAAISPVAHTIDVVVATLPSDPGNIVSSDADLETLVSRLSTYWNSQSDGQVASFTITDSVQRIVTENACDAEMVWEEVAATLFDEPIDAWWLSPARHLLVVVPEECGEGSGLGSVGSGLEGGVTWAAYSSATFELTVAHELGHNLTLRHSNAMECDEVDACSDREYYDFYDVMGGGLSVGGRGNDQLPALNVTQKKRIDGLSGTDLVTVSLSPSSSVDSTTFTLYPASAASGLRGLEVLDPNTGDVYYVEYRSGTGIDAGSIYARGIAVGYAPGLRVLRIRGDDSSAALTLAGSTARNLYLDPGQSLTSIGDGATVLFESDGATAQVVVTLSADLLALTAGTPAVSGTLTVGSRLSAAAGTWGPAPVSLSYQWLRDGTAISGATSSFYDVTLADARTRISVTVTGAKDGYASFSRSSASTAPVPLAVQRFGGRDRYATAIAMSASYPRGVPVLYVARGDSYPDALSAAPAAAAGGGPLLLVTTTTLPATVKTEIERLRPDKIVVVGGTGSVNAAVYGQLAELVPSPTDITRQGGANRYASSRLIVDRAFGEAGVDRVYLATGRDFPDALSASAAAGANNAAVILVDGLAGGLDAETVALITKLNPRDIVLAGGTGVVSAGIEAAAKVLRPGAGTQRLRGADRFATSLALNNDGFGASETVYFATGYNFPDALAGAPLAGANGAPLYVVPGTCVPASMVTAILANGVRRVVLFGGTGTISARVETLTPCAS